MTKAIPRGGLFTLTADVWEGRCARTKGAKLEATGGASQPTPVSSVSSAPGLTETLSFWSHGDLWARRSF